VSESYAARSHAPSEADPFCLLPIIEAARGWKFPVGSANGPDHPDNRTASTASEAANFFSMGWRLAEMAQFAGTFALEFRPPFAYVQDRPVFWPRRALEESPSLTLHRGAAQCTEVSARLPRTPLQTASSHKRIPPVMPASLEAIWMLSGRVTVTRAAFPPPRYRTS
jgi:hypothetical protein